MQPAWGDVTMPPFPMVRSGLDAGSPQRSSLPAMSRSRRIRQRSRKAGHSAEHEILTTEQTPGQAEEVGQVPSFCASQLPSTAGSMASQGTDSKHLRVMVAPWTKRGLSARAMALLQSHGVIPGCTNVKMPCAMPQKEAHAQPWAPPDIAMCTSRDTHDGFLPRASEQMQSGMPKCGSLPELAWQEGMGTPQQPSLLSRSSPSMPAPELSTMRSRSVDFLPWPAKKSCLSSPGIAQHHQIPPAEILDRDWRKHTESKLHPVSQTRSDLQIACDAPRQRCCLDAGNVKVTAGGKHFRLFGVDVML